jgi:3-hydroxyisobutyrate dehydrogenase
MTRIGFIGLGHMGLPMATHLIEAGHTVIGFDLQPLAMANFTQKGGHAASSVREAVNDADIVVTMLQTGQQVKDVALGESGLLALMRRGALYIDCSTIDVASARELHQAAEVLGVHAVDAPVSGGVAGASAATLTFMVGGTEAAFLRAQPLLMLMGKKIIHAGIAGNGQAAKICNNMILGISMIAVSEAFVLAESLGLTPQKLFEVVTNASGQCWVMNSYVPVPDVLENVPANHDYAPGFTVAMMLKDLRLSQAVAASTGERLPMAQQATELYQQFSNAGKAELDFSAIISQTRHPEP